MFKVIVDDKIYCVTKLVFNEGSVVEVEGKRDGKIFLFREPTHFDLYQYDADTDRYYDFYIHSIMLKED